MRPVLRARSIDVRKFAAGGGDQHEFVAVFYSDTVQSYTLICSPGTHS